MLKLSPTRTIIRGDSDVFRLTFTKKISNQSNSGCGCNKKETTYPIDITGWDISFTVRPEVPSTSITDDTDALISEKGTIIDAENGVAIIYVQSENTTTLLPGTYYYDIQVTKPLDEYGHHQVSSIRRGKYVVLGDITRNESIPVPADDTGDDIPPQDDDTDDDADDGYHI